MRKIAFFAAAMLAAGTACASHCPQEMKKIDDAMAKNPKLSATQRADVKKFRTEGETLRDRRPTYACAVRNTGVAN